MWPIEIDASKKVDGVYYRFVDGRVIGNLIKNYLIFGQLNIRI